MSAAETRLRPPPRGRGVVRAGPGAGGAGVSPLVPGTKCRGTYTRATDRKAYVPCREYDGRACQIFAAAAGTRTAGNPRASALTPARGQPRPPTTSRATSFSSLLWTRARPRSSARALSGGRRGVRRARALGPFDARSTPGRRSRLKAVMSAGDCPGAGASAGASASNGDRPSSTRAPVTRAPARRGRTAPRSCPGCRAPGVQRGRRARTSGPSSRVPSTGEPLAGRSRPGPSLPPAGRVVLQPGHGGPSPSRGRRRRCRRARPSPRSPPAGRRCAARADPAGRCSRRTR